MSDANRDQLGDGEERRPRRKKKVSKDIAPVLKGWDFEAGTINVRKVLGLDGVPKLQMRLDLGLLQMEMNGRPDGEKPHGCESLLDYYEQRLREYTAENGGESGFVLSPDDCEALRGEAVMYYHRYLSLLVLEEFAGVVRDTARNIKVIDFCAQYAEDEQDRLVLEQYRPYITMMNARAGASILFKQKKYREALEAVEAGLGSIREFFVRFGQEEAYNESNEVKVLKRFARDIRKKLPVDPVEKLQRQLDRAVEEERYEDAARLRDEINAIKSER
ncbi:MAG TPA: UvrB/UvrC motif-containing protein [Tepidisphaeraceae bacterium]|nr:UvrB/UvrC motif-containing protein [Tepidisphaeraceae bacterium]